MRHYQVRDVMTAGLMTVTPSTPVKEVAGMLVRLQAGALPVVTPRDGAAIYVRRPDPVQASAAGGFQGIPGISVTTAPAAASAWRETR